MDLFEAQERREYIVEAIETQDAELDSFLLTLGCYAGESIFVILHRKDGLIAAVKDGRYNIDKTLAKAIKVRCAQ